MWPFAHRLPQYASDADAWPCVTDGILVSPQLSGRGNVASMAVVANTALDCKLCARHTRHTTHIHTPQPAVSVPTRSTDDVASDTGIAALAALEGTNMRRICTQKFQSGLGELGRIPTAHFRAGVLVRMDGGGSAAGRMRTRSQSMHSDDMLEGLDIEDPLADVSGSSATATEPSMLRGNDGDEGGSEGGSSGSGSGSESGEEDSVRKPTKKVCVACTVRCCAMLGCNRQRWSVPPLPVVTADVEVEVSGVDRAGCRPHVDVCRRQRYCGNASSRHPCTQRLWSMNGTCIVVRVFPWPAAAAWLTAWARVLRAAWLTFRVFQTKPRRS